MTRTAANARALCVQTLHDVIGQNRYLDTALGTRTPLAGNDAALVQEMSYGCLRWYHQLDAIASRLLDKPLKEKDNDIHLLLLLGLYQLRHMNVAPHAAVDETVKTATALGKPWAKGLINACLRKYLREPTLADDVGKENTGAHFSHPLWMIDIIKRDHPAQWESILQANNERPPMTLRVNLRQQTRATYLEHLHANGIGARALDSSPSAVALEKPVAVSVLPDFKNGDVSVQDAAAQLAAAFLDPHAGERVLDACAAPGGKAAHLLEWCADLDLLALDTDSKRAPLIEQNLKRLGLATPVRVADAAQTASWWDGREFDRILLDVPCSASGVIRRNPDIKLRRQPQDLEKLEATQAQLLAGVWPTLRRGGKLLYATCSVFARENEDRIAAFLAAQPDAVEQPLTCAWATPRRHGIQILPGTETMDGFFYACLAKG